MRLAEIGIHFTQSGETMRTANTVDTMLDGEQVKRNYSLYEVGYIKLRTGIGVLALAFPLIFLISSSLLHRTEMQPSISEYYITRELERNLFVGILICVGIFLWLYEGYSYWENRILDAAGVLLALVALVPVSASSFTLGDTVIPVRGHIGGMTFSVHGFCAVTFFICIIVVSTVFSRTTLKGRPDRAKWIRIYTIIATWMFIGIGLSALSGVFHQSWLGRLFDGKGVFWVEAFGVWGFATFWLVKTKEVNPTIQFRPLPLRRADMATRRH